MARPSRPSGPLRPGASTWVDSIQNSDMPEPRVGSINDQRKKCRNFWILGDVPRARSVACGSWCSSDSKRTDARIIDVKVTCSFLWKALPQNWKGSLSDNRGAFWFSDVTGRKMRCGAPRSNPEWNARFAAIPAWNPNFSQRAFRSKRLAYYCRMRDENQEGIGRQCCPYPYIASWCNTFSKRQSPASRSYDTFGQQDLGRMSKSLRLREILWRK